MYDFDDHELFVSPQVSVYSSEKGGASRHMMVNGSDKRMAIKIKCSNNDIYRVSPVYCLLEPGMSQRLQVVRDSGPAKVDKIVLLYKFTTYASAREAFSDGGEEGADVSKKLIALVAREDVAARPTPTNNLRSILRSAYPKGKVK